MIQVQFDWQMIVATGNVITDDKAIGNDKVCYILLSLINSQWSGDIKCIKS